VVSVLGDGDGEPVGAEGVDNAASAAAAAAVAVAEHGVPVANREGAAAEGDTASRRWQGAGRGQAAAGVTLEMYYLGKHKARSGGYDFLRAWGGRGRQAVKVGGEVRGKGADRAVARGEERGG